MPRTKLTTSPDDVSMSVLSKSMRIYRANGTMVAKIMGISQPCYSKSRKNNPEKFNVKEIKKLASAFKWTDAEVIEFIFGRKAVFNES